MTIERVRPAIFRVTLHAYELSALIAAARWVADGAKGELTEEAVQQLKQVLEGYDAATARVDTADRAGSSTVK